MDTDIVIFNNVFFDFPFCLYRLHNAKYVIITIKICKYVVIMHKSFQYLLHFAVIYAEMLSRRKLTICTQPSIRLNITDGKNGAVFQQESRCRYEKVHRHRYYG